jgi:hypothetical protein
VSCSAIVVHDPTSRSFERSFRSGITSPAPRGLDGTVAAETRLSQVDVLAGRLVIGGYSIEELAEHVSFELATFAQDEGILFRVQSRRRVSSDPCFPSLDWHDEQSLSDVSEGFQPLVCLFIRLRHLFTARDDGRQLGDDSLEPGFHRGAAL